MYFKHFQTYVKTTTYLNLAWAACVNCASSWGGGGGACDLEQNIEHNIMYMGGN
jgi:hypothetical protein